MDIILNNPFRILGLPVTASERTVARRISDLVIFAEMGKSVSYDTDFPFLSALLRTPESVRQASARIEQPEGRLFYSLFWFRKNNDPDQMAFELLEKNEVEKAINIWIKYAHQNISVDNYSCIRNLSILYMGLAAGNLFPNSGKQLLLSNGITLFGKTFSSGLFEKGCRTFSGMNALPDKMKIGRAFADEMLEFVGRSEGLGGIKTGALVESFRTFPGEIFSHVTEKFVNKPIQRIEATTADVREKRALRPHDADQIGKHLYQTTLDDLIYLRTLLSPSDLRYQLIADKLANEILQCCIDYFNVTMQERHDSGKKALPLLRHADDIAVGGRVKSRVGENRSLMESWIKAAPLRKRQHETSLLTEDIAGQLNNFPDVAASADAEQLPSIARHLFDHCIGKLLIIRAAPDADTNHGTCLNLSSALANHISELSMRYSEQTGDHTEAIRLMEKIGTLDMLPEIRDRYDKNNEILTQRRESRIFNNMRESSPDEKKACYIATMVYGEGSSQVSVLRAFRDRTLGKSVLGRYIIRNYHRYSPLFVAKFGHSEGVRRGTEILLNGFVFFLSHFRVGGEDVGTQARRAKMKKKEC